MSANRSSSDAIEPVSRSPVTLDGRQDFFNLPFEIRQHIYRALLINTEGEVRIGLSTRSGCRSSNIAPQILRTCKQIYDEAITVLYELNEFCTRDPLAFYKRYRFRMGHHNINRIRKFCFNLDTDRWNLRVELDLVLLSVILKQMSSLQSFTIKTPTSRGRDKVLGYIFRLNTKPHTQAQALLESLGDGGGEYSMRVVLRGAVQVGSEEKLLDMDHTFKLWLERRDENFTGRARS